MLQKTISCPQMDDGYNDLIYKQIFGIQIFKFQDC